MAGRESKPWYWAERGAWFVTIRGTRHLLGKDKSTALQRFHELMAGGGNELPKVLCVGVAGPTLAEVLSRYLTCIERRVKPSTLAVTRQYLKPFVQALGNVALDRLTPADIDIVVRGQTEWGGTTEHHARGRLVTALNWAVKNRLIPANPLAGLWRPPARSRGAETISAAGDVAKLIDAAPEYLRNVLTALQQTGARPCEVLSVTAADFDPGAGVWILHDHKTAGKTGAPRVVFLPPAVVELCKTLAARHPSGPLFRRATGTPFPGPYYLPRLVRILRRKLGLPESIIPYGFRHTFATDALANGVPEAHVAELLGHKGTAMLHKHYAHLGTKAAVLRAALGRVRGENGN